MIDIVIVNWNSGLQIKRCIHSLIIHEQEDLAHIVVLDNASTDGSTTALESLTNVKVRYSATNLGFGAACNLGAKSGNSPYILFLNPDTRLERNSLSVPLKFMEQPENSTVGVCGIQLVDEQSKVSRTCARLPTLGRFVSSALGVNKLPGLSGSGIHMSDWDHDTSREVDHVMGAFYLVRRELFEQVGGFDERFFVYLEDVDLSKVVKDAGFSIWYLTEANAFHAGGGASRQVKAHRLFYSLRSRLLYAFKHFPQWKAWCLLAVTNLLEPLTRTIWCLLRRDFAGVKYTWAAYRMLWRSMGHILRGDGRYNP
ncbi:glycosyltransferase family 2 protein [Marinobacterium lutimaris]|uniref:Glycosyltransferase 2-like domain-containing protein n=1 Tax=Marinobacterium lutimaris TaxID=568106 RepID=A0A1H6B8Q4_9GAMM|nr:glycosyltransferase family 2 protein [Marinobacterium lutimaris]SEG57223.1 hypothetical protein SAMN05444390_102479 [Marinobacterium lutimaris]